MAHRALVACIILWIAPDLAAQSLVQLTGRTWVRIGTDESSANAALYVGDHSALLVDPGPSPAGVRELLREAGKLTDRPVRFIVLSDWRAAHAMGALCLRDLDLRVVAHPRARRRIAEQFAAMRQRSAGQLDSCLPQLPEPLIEERRLIDLGNHRVEILHAADAESLVVWSADERVLAIGDLLRHGTLPGLERLAALRPRYAVPGHLAVESGARFERNLRAARERLARKKTEDVGRGTFRTLAVLEVGQAPRQISFGKRGSQAFVAVSGADRITRIDVGSLRISGARPVEGRPVGVAGLPGGELLVSGAENGKLSLYRPGEFEPAALLDVGRSSSSYLVGPIDGRRFLIPIESASRIRALDAPTFRYRASYETGGRPLPPAVTSDGRKAFVPNRDDGTVTVIDLWNERARDVVDVGGRPTAATVLADDTQVAVTLTDDDRLVFLDVVTHEVTRQLPDGLGPAPSAIAASSDGRYLFVGYAELGEVSVLQTADRRWIARLPVGGGPTSLAVDPAGRTLWVGCGGSDEIHVIRIPQPVEQLAGERPTEVAVLGTIGSDHLASDEWDLGSLRETIRRYAPEVVCAAIPPDRWRSVWEGWAERGEVDDPYLAGFPEYTDVLLPLVVETGLQIEPCSAWSEEMEELRRSRLRQFESDAGLAVLRRDYERKRAELLARHAAKPLDDGDPRVLHSARYDARQREEMDLVVEYLDEWVGPGGWSRIRQRQYRRIESALQRHAGRRVLVLVDAKQKYWFVERLRNRAGVRWIDIAPYLPARDS